MALKLTLPAVTIGTLQIPERTFTEGIDFEIGSMLQEGETAYREGMVAILPAGNNSQVFRDYAQHIGSQRAVLFIDPDQITDQIPDRPPAQMRPEVPGGFSASSVRHTSIIFRWSASARATGYDIFLTTTQARPTEGTAATASVGAVTTYTATGLSPSTAYRAYIRAKSAAGNSAWSRVVLVTTPVPPLSKPAVVTGFGSTGHTHNSIAYSWTAVSGATSYDLFFSESSTAPAQNAQGSASVGAVTAYTLRGVSAETQYYAYVRAVNSAGTSDWSAAVSVTTSAAPVVAPGIPAGFGSTARTHNSITYGWSAVAGATGYDIYISTTRVLPSAGTTPTASDLTTLTYTRAGLSGVTTYYAYVRAKNSAGTSRWSGALPVATLLAPPPAVSGFSSSANTYDSITYGWTASARATGYDLYITTSEALPDSDTAPTVSIGALTTYTRTGISASTQYRAYIRAKNSTAASVWSAAVVVTTANLPPPAVPTDFAGTSEASNVIAYTWTASPRASGYDLYIATDNVAPHIRVTPTVSVGAVTAYTRRGLLANTRYQAYIRATNDRGTSAWSAAISVVTSAAAPVPAPAVPTGFESTGATQTTITYAWDAAVGVTGYDLYFSTTSTAPTAGTAPTVSLGAVATYTRAALTASTQYYAWLRAQNARGASDWTAAVAVTTPAVPPAIPPTPTGFASTASTFDTITYGWTAAPRATTYDLYITTSATAPTSDTAATVVVGGVTTYIHTELSENTTYRAYIRANNVSGSSAWSLAATVTTPLEPKAPGVPADFASSANTYRSITYGWTATTGATGYDIYITTSMAAPTAQTTPTGYMGAVTAYQATGLTARTQYRAYLRAKNALGNSAWTSAVTVTTAAIPTPAVPTNFGWTGATSTSIDYTWAASRHATGYDLYFSTTATAPTAQTAGTVSVGAVTAYSRTGLTANTTYYAYVRAKNTSGTSAWSAAVTVGTSSVPTAPLGSIDRAADDFRLTGKTTTTLSFDWDDIEFASNYYLFLKTSAGVPTSLSGQTYRGRTSAYTATGLSPGTTYYAYVNYDVHPVFAGIFGGSQGKYTPALVVKTADAVPVPVPAPAVPTGFHVTRRTGTTITYAWRGSALATGYDIFFDTRPGRPTAQTTPTVFLGNFTNYVYPRVDSGVTIYAWLRARNESGTSAWSEVVGASTLLPPQLAPGVPETPVTVPRVQQNFISTAHTFESITYEWKGEVGVDNYELYITNSHIAPSAATPATVTLGADAVSYQRTGLTQGTLYYAYLRGRNSVGASPWTRSVNVSTLFRPPDPVENWLSNGQGINNLYFTWSAPFGATLGRDGVLYGDLTYDIYLTTSSTPPTAETPATRNVRFRRGPSQYEWRGLTRNTRYYAYIRARNRGGTSAWSEEASSNPHGPTPLWTTNPRPITPTNFAVDIYSHNTIATTWTPSPNTDTYEVVIKPTRGRPQVGSRITARVTEPRYTFTGLSPNTTYYMYVRGRNISNPSRTLLESNWTELVQRTDAEITVPQNFTVQAATDTSITFAWSAVAGAVGYDLYVTEGVVAPLITPTISVGEVTTATVTGLKARTAYRAYIRARTRTTGGFVTEWSDPLLTNTSIPVPGVPTRLTRTTATETSITVTWPPVSGATGYDLYISDRRRAIPETGTPPTGSVSDGETYRFTGLTKNTVYDIWARATNVAGKSAWSDPSFRISTLQYNEGPANFRQTGSTANTISYAWDALPVDESYYVIVRTNGTEPHLFGRPSFTIHSGTTFTFTAPQGTAAGTTYWAWIHGQTSALSGPVIAALGTETMAPAAAPTNVRFSVDDSAVYTMQWDAVTGATSYDYLVKETDTVPTDSDAFANSIARTFSRGYSGTNYFFVRGRNAAGAGPWAAALTLAQYDSVPAVPADLASTASTASSLSFSWSAAARAQEYELEIVPLVGGTAQVVSAEKLLAHTITGLDFNRYYRTRVRATNFAGNGDWSDYVLARTAVDTTVTAPVTPTGLGVTDIKALSLAFEWDAVAGADAYDFFVTDPTTTPTAETVPTVRTTATTYRATGLMPETNHYAYVRARNDGGTSAWSAAARVRTNAVPGLPFVPRDFTSSASTYNTITYNWTAGFRAEGYDFYISTEDAAPTAETTPTASFGEVTTYTATGLSVDTEYHAYIRSTNEGGKSAWSSATSVTTPDFPPPTNFRRTASTANTITYTWTAAPNATGYDLIFFPFNAFHSELTLANAVSTASVGNVTTYTWTRPDDESTRPTWWAYIRSTDATGVGSFSDPVVAAVGTATAAPTVAPMGLRFSRNRNGSYVVVWDAVSDATSYDGVVKTTNVVPTGADFIQNVASPRYAAGHSDTRYLFVRARNAAGVGPWTAGFALEPFTQVPAVPTNFRITGQTSSSITYEWALAARAERYQLSWSQVRSGRVIGGTVNVSNVRGLGVVTGLLANTEYSARVRALNDAPGQLGPWSNYVTGYTAADTTVTAPAVPADFTTTSVTHNRIDLSWSAVTGAREYEIYFSTSATAPTAQTRGIYRRITGTTDYIRASNLQPETTYYIYVRAVNNGGNSAWSAAVTATTLATPVAPSVPTGLTSVVPTSGSLTFRWSAASGAESYDLYITTEVTAPTAQTTPTVSQWPSANITQTRLQPNTTYRAYVRARNAGGTSDWSAAVMATTLSTADLPVPTGFNVRQGTPADTTVQLVWQAVTGATGYDIYAFDRGESRFGAPLRTAVPPRRGTIPTASAGAVTTYTLTGLKPSTVYTFWVRSKNSATASDWSHSRGTATGAPAPGVPADFRVTFNRPGDRLVQFEWTREPNATGYDFYYSTSATPPTASTAPTHSVGSGSTTSQQFFHFPRGVLQYIYIRAKNAAGTSAWSSALTFTKA